MWQFVPGVKVANFGNSAILLNVPTARYFSLNRTGALVCSGIAESSDTVTIIEHVQRECGDVDPQGIASDVLDFLKKLEGLRLCRQIEKK